MQPHDPVALLVRAGTILSESLDLDRTLARVVEVVLPALGDFGFIDVVVAEGEVRRVPMAYQDPVRQALLEQTRWVRSDRSDINLCALSSGRSGLHPAIDEAWLADVAVSPEHLDLMKELAFGSMLTVPLPARGRVIGALTLFHVTGGRRHDDNVLRLAEDVALRTALALDNALLFADLQRREEETRRAYIALKEAHRRKDDFLALLGHELRNPLSPIVTAVELMKTGRPGALEHARDVIGRQAKHLVRLADDLMDVSRIARGLLELERARVDAASVVATAVEQAAPSIERFRHRLEVHVPGVDLEMDADEQRLAQVLTNLLTNAAKYTPPGGNVSLEVWRDADAVCFRVSDDGAGIDPEELPRLFQRFEQGFPTPQRGGGLGLGLAIARSLVEMHGGTLEAASDGPGSGTAFTVRLPAAAQATAAIGRAASSRPAAPGPDSSPSGDG